MVHDVRHAAPVHACAMIAAVRASAGVPLLLVCLSWSAAGGCGSNGASPSPSNPPSSQPPATQDPIPAIAGEWIGTFESPNLPARAISFTMVQSAGYCIDGAWKDTTNQWTGALSGVATSTEFSGS